MDRSQGNESCSYGSFAAAQFTKMLEHKGFREWYDPATGTGYGANEQLWSAVLLLRAADAMFNDR